MALNGNWEVLSRAGRNMHYHEVSRGRSLGESCENQHPVCGGRCWGIQGAGQQGNFSARKSEGFISSRNYQGYGMEKALLGSPGAVQRSLLFGSLIP